MITKLNLVQSLVSELIESNGPNSLNENESKKAYYTGHVKEIVPNCKPRIS